MSNIFASLNKKNQKLKFQIPKHSYELEFGIYNLEFKPFLER